MELFYKEFPPKVPIGFIIMRFGSEPEHVAILDALKRASIRCGVTLIRADHRIYHEDLMENVRVYMHGCSFGIAIFEDAESKGFNPNVSLEVGYLQALGKPVLPLKSPSLPRLPSDLLSKLYLDYEPMAIQESTILQISDWIARRIQIKKVSDRLSTSVSTVTSLLQELYPSIPIQDGDQHLASHVAGLLQYNYRSVGAVRKLLASTEAARAWVSFNHLPEFATCAISHAIALHHTEYTKLPVWKRTTALRLKEAKKLFLT
jgi:hypothetical protein